MKKKILFAGLLGIIVVSVLVARRSVAAGQRDALGPGMLTLDAKPLHHYAFKGSALTDSVGSANGTLLNGAVVEHGVLSLDGVSAYVEFNEPLIPISDAFSVAFFAQELSPASDRAELISQGRWFGPGFYIGYYPPSRSLRVGDEWQATGVRFPGDRHWHHYALTVNANTSRFYIDGVLATNSEPIHIAAGGNNTRLGRQYEPWPEYFHGALAELWIYEGALTADEVSALAAAAPNLPAESLLASLIFGSGGKAARTLLFCLAALFVAGLLVFLWVLCAERRQRLRSAEGAGREKSEANKPMMKP